MPQRKPTSGAPGSVIEVTQEDIDDAVRRDSGHCMISMAVKRAVSHAAYIATDLQTTRYTDLVRRERYVFLTARVAQIALVAFDQGLKPEPFSFRLQRGQTIPMQTTAAGKAYYKKRGKATRTRLVAKKLADRTLIGGTAPPVAALNTSKGQRREFGMRGLKL